VEREKRAALGSDDEPTPAGVPAREAFAAKPEDTKTPVERPERVEPRPRSTPPPLPPTLLEGVEKAAKPSPPAMPPPSPARGRNGSGPRAAKQRARPPPALEKPAVLQQAPPEPVLIEKTPEPGPAPLPIEEQKTQLRRAPEKPP